MVFFVVFGRPRSSPGGRGVSSPAWRITVWKLAIWGVTPKPFLRRRLEETAELIVDLLKEAFRSPGSRHVRPTAKWSRRATPKPGAVGGGRCVGGPATAGPCPWGAARLAAARLRRFEVFGIGVRCCSVSAQRHAVSGSVPKARHRRFGCGRVPSRRTRLLVALERAWLRPTIRRREIA